MKVFFKFRILGFPVGLFYLRPFMVFILSIGCSVFTRGLEDIFPILQKNPSPFYFLLLPLLILLFIHYRVFKRMYAKNHIVLTLIISSIAWLLLIGPLFMIELHRLEIHCTITMVIFRYFEEFLEHKLSDMHG